MPIYIFAINANQENPKDKKDHYGCLARYDIEASSGEDARELGFKRFCQENPDRSHNPNDYTTDVGSLKKN